MLNLSSAPLIGASASNKSRGIAWIDLSWQIEDRIECNSSLDRAPIIEGAAGAIKICGGGGGGRKRSMSHPGVTIRWPIYISRGFSARPLNVK